jgi:hypothetical protein
LLFLELISVSFKNKVPSEGLSRQPMMFRMVVFPEPDGPAMDKNSPLSIEKDIRKRYFF